LGRLVDTARERVEQLERQRQELPAALAAAHRQLDGIETLAVRGAEAMALARAKIAAPAGILQPLDPQAEGDHGLRPGLVRIQQQADSGAWEVAAGALGRWKKAADDWEANVKRVAEANAAPVAHRN